MEDLNSFGIVSTTDINVQQQQLQFTNDDAEYGNGNGSSILPSVDPTASTSTSCDLFTFTLYVIVQGALCAFGLIGNTISFVVLRAEKHSHVATFLLQAMAVADNMFLATTALSQMTTALTESVYNEYSDADDQFYYSYTFMTYVKDVYYLYSLVLTAMMYTMVYVWPVVHVCQMWTVWITVLVAFNRYVAICLPFQATRLCTMSQARIQVACCAVSIWLYNVPRFFEHELQWRTDAPEEVAINSSATNSSMADDDDASFVEFMSFPEAVETNLKHNLAYNIIYENILYCFFVFLGPLVVLVFLNTCLIRELYHARRRLRERHLPGSASGPEQGEHNLTLVMIVIVVVFVVCQTPAFINQLLSVIGVEDTCGRTYFYYYHLSNLFITTNSALNFVVYCVFRRHFRRRLRAFFCECIGWNGGGRRRRGSDGSLVQPCPTEQHGAGVELRTTSNHHRATPPKASMSDERRAVRTTQTVVQA